MSRRADFIALVGRILLAAIFLTSGWSKLMNPAGTIQYLTSLGLPIPPLTYFLTVVVELLGGLAFLVGFRARWAALVLAGFCVLTAVMVHYHPNDRGQMINFWKNVAMTGGFLQVVAWGAGRFSVDRR
jgi:putative oxidoreductase